MLTEKWGRAHINHGRENIVFTRRRQTDISSRSDSIGINKPIDDIPFEIAEVKQFDCLG